MLDGFERLGVDLAGRRDDLARQHVLDALIAAHTGTLAWERLEAPPSEFNAAAGWIWLPKKPTAASSAGPEDQAAAA